MALLGVGMPAVSAAPASAAPLQAAPKPAGEERRALQQAAETGERVEVVGARTEFETTYANPDGVSFRLEQSVVPVRVRNRAGDWAAPDPTLERRSDGTVGPKAAAVGISFSGGGDGAGLVKIDREGRSLALGWPGRLPVPVLDGASAVYANVLPDVDLRMTATTEGFREVLVVKTPAAAANPELKKITFSMKADRLKVSPTESGGMAAVDANANEVFTVPPAMMWDSSANKNTPPPAPPASPARGSASPGTSTGPNATSRPNTTGRNVSRPPAVSAAAGENAGGPRAGDDIANLPIQVARDTISLVPDSAMLRQTDPEVFPLYIDPPVTWGEAERTLLRSDGYKDWGWDNMSDNKGKGAGKCGSWNGYYCGPGYVQRLYFEFSPSPLVGKHILDASFRITEPWAFQCDPRWVDLVRTSDISTATSWSSRPKILDLMVDRQVSAGRGSLCDPDSPDAPIEFNDNPAETNENLTATVRSFAAGTFDRLTLMIKATDEGDTSAWKRFKNDATLVVDYVGRPNYPASFGFLTGSGISCSKAADAPSTISDPTPQVAATVRTQVGGSPGAQLRGLFKVERKDGGSWTPLPDFVSPTSGFVGTGVAVKPTVPQILQEGPLYRITSSTRSYYNSAKNWLTSGSPGYCYFKVDTTAPKPPVVTPGTVYTLCTATACEPKGGPGIKDTFTFARNPADTGTIVSYQYRRSSDSQWSSQIPGATVRQTIVPPDSGTYQLEVRAWDSAGRPGASQIVSFLVKEGDGPVGRWRFDETSGTAVDSSTTVPAGQDNATLGSGAVRDDRGRRGEIRHDAQGQPLPQPRNDRGLKLNGTTTGYAATAGPVLETRSAYTVAAWARLDGKNDHMMLLSQDGTTQSPFILSYDKTADTWYFGVRGTDAADGTTHGGKKGNAPARVGVWTHVAGTYDPVDKLLKLYVNGVLQGTVSVTSSWSATGPLQFGRAKFGGGHHYAFNGSIDEAAVWQRELQPDEIAKEARSLSAVTGFRDVELVADWRAEGASGTTLTDTTSGYGRGLALSGGAALNGEAIVLDGTDDAATTAGPVIDETGGFTVTTAVELDRVKLLTKPAGYVGQVTGQRTGDGSSWGLWFELTGKETRYDDEGNPYEAPLGLWRFGRVNKDGTKDWVSSDEVADLGTPVRLTGVFDPVSDDGPVIRLHVGLPQNDMDRTYKALVGSGDFAVGKGFSATNWSHHLPGQVREVRLWAGAMTSTEQIEAVIGG
ncbi:LamG domain-containing protein [Streptomyces sp. NPDC051018]|uniref:LamG domain-containing protein n=1 Tax=Streptomyces sp. NPDC051018 TaxID=3365639 RepID=UPI00379D69CA